MYCMQSRFKGHYALLPKLVEQLDASLAQLVVLSPVPGLEPSAAAAAEVALLFSVKCSILLVLMYIYLFYYSINIIIIINNGL